MTCNNRQAAKCPRNVTGLLHMAVYRLIVWSVAGTTGSLSSAQIVQTVIEDATLPTVSRINKKDLVVP